MPPLLIVSRHRPDLLSRFREAFEDFPQLEIVLDRRERPRREATERALHAYGWALIDEDPEPVDQRPGARRILVADDHEDTRHLLGWVLRRAGHDVMDAGDGDIAIVKARAWRPDLAIVDMFMPEKDGAEVIRALRSPNDLDVLDDARAEGADAVMSKPIDPRALLGVVEKLLVS
jgi:CheY-like chemotaxis protein